MNMLTVPRQVLGQALRRIGPPNQSVRCPAGVSWWDGHCELLVGHPGRLSEQYVLLVRGGSFGTPPGVTPECAGVLTLGVGHLRGQAEAFARLASGLEPIDQLKLVGPGMHVLTLGPSMVEAGLPANLDALRERWSRTIAALGEEVWRRLTRLHYGIVGVGRRGSILAEALAAGWGVERLSLIDPDVMEAYNLGEMASVMEADCGQAKAAALARRVCLPELSRPVITAVAGSITHVPALHAAQACDVLFGCLDHDGARLALAALAVLFCKPYVDIATGIHGQADRRMGVDVRLLVPGERCLLCLGDLADPAGARQVLASADAEQAFYAGRDWRQERAGSLRSLNQLAVAVALRMWEDFIAWRAEGSTWVHLEFDGAGRMTVAYPPIASPVPCRLCPLLALGEGGLSATRALFRENAAPNPQRSATILGGP
jgi:molybdopterin/thiamine biosynthesis adenylyltransferase